MLKITYKTRKIEKVCTIAIEAEKKYGLEMAEKRESKRPICDGFSTSLPISF